jgi:hypothetical protein
MWVSFMGFPLKGKKRSRLTEIFKRNRLMVPVWYALKATKVIAKKVVHKRIVVGPVTAVVQPEKYKKLASVAYAACKSSSENQSNQADGGARAGGGAAVRAAKTAAGLLCSTWPKGCGGVAVFITTGTGAPPTRHSGQNSAAPASAATVVTLPSSASTTLSMPAPVQITSSVCGLTTEDATATPSVNANHSKASLASQGLLRRVCKRVMGRDYGIGVCVKK